MKKRLNTSSENRQKLRRFECDMRLYNEYEAMQKAGRHAPFSRREKMVIRAARRIDEQRPRGQQLYYEPLYKT